MLALADLGSMVEVGFGRRRFLLTYFVGGLVSGLSSEVWHATDVALGASGAIFALIGLLIPLTLYRKVIVKIDRRLLSSGNILAFSAYNLFVGSLTPGIDNAGHLGGFAPGLVYGLILAYRVTPRTVEITEIRRSVSPAD